MTDRPVRLGQLRQRLPPTPTLAELSKPRRRRAPRLRRGGARYGSDAARLGAATATSTLRTISRQEYDGELARPDGRVSRVNDVGAGRVYRPRIRRRAKMRLGGAKGALHHYSMNPFDCAGDYTVPAVSVAAVSDRGEQHCLRANGTGVGANPQRLAPGGEIPGPSPPADQHPAYHAAAIRFVFRPASDLTSAAGAEARSGSDSR